jgi:hypothetical protein
MVHSFLKVKYFFTLFFILLNLPDGGGEHPGF